MRSPDALDGVPLQLRAPIVACARGELPANVALMRMSAVAESGDALTTLLSQAADAFAVAGRRAEAVRLRDALDLWSSSPDAWRTIRTVLGQVDSSAMDEPSTDAVASWSSIFDRLSRVAPEAGVALYALGRADLLQAATDEVATLMRDRGLLRKDCTVLDIGCGIGRFLPALSAAAGFVVGLEIAHGMLTVARERCRGLGNVALARGSGRSLAAFRDDAFDLVCAIDSFPYIVDAGEDVVARHFAEAHRVLKPGGRFLIVNYSYRGSLDADRADAARAADRSGFSMVENGGGGLRYWDGRVFEMAKPAARRPARED